MTNFEDVEKVFKKYHIRTETIFTRKSRLLKYVLDDTYKKWNKMADEDKDIILGYFTGPFLEIETRRKELKEKFGE